MTDENKKDEQTAGREASLSAPTGYLAVHHDQHPLTGDSIPVALNINEDTTVGELVRWYRKYRGESAQVFDLRIVQTDNVK